jgi:thiopeptide-type bacteriocin biosynthesis protein
VSDAKITAMAHDAEFTPSGFFVLRTPLLPFGELLDWAEGAGDNRGVLRQRLRAIASRPEVREAIMVASPALEELVGAWARDAESPRGRQCERALVRYVARMAGRATPFGLFAGVSTGELGDDTSLVLEGRDRYRRATRLDAGYLVDVLEALLEEPEYRERLTFRPNPSLYRCGDRRRYVHSRPGAEDDRHRLISVRDSASLEVALAAAADGARPAELRRALVAEGHPDEPTRRYVDELIDRQVLLPDLDVQLTGGDATHGLGDVVPELAEVRTELAALDASALGQPPERYRRLAAGLAELPVEAKLERLFQVDMTKESPSASLGPEIVKELLHGVELLQHVGYHRSAPTELERFAQRFQERYEGEPVPLLEALDPDAGIGFGDESPARSPLLDGVGTANGRPPSRDWSLREDHLLARLVEVQAAGRDELVLDRRDLERLAADDPPPLPDAFAAMGVLAASSTSALAAGRFRLFVQGAVGPSGARLLGRFCHADAHLRAAVEEHLRAEEALDPDAVFAEVVHVPRARDANVAARPLLREYEIACLTGSGAPAERQLALSDLLVSVERGRVVVRSRGLGRRIVPRLTSAHNFAWRGMVAYRFLCALQEQGLAASPGLWGPLATAPVLPRIRHGRLVLATARWRLDAATVGDGDAYRAVQQWRATRRVPRFVALVDFGGQLPVDLDNALAVDSLVQTVRAAGWAQVAEFFPPPDELVVQGPEGPFVHELVVPFVRTAPPVVRRSTARPEGRLRRRFAPGSEWLYVRVYTGETVADDVLTGGIGPLVRNVRHAGLVDRWFFLRYRDPEFHLRVRLHGDRAALREEVRPAVDAAGERLVDDGLAWRVELGTYQREAERYGGPEAIEHVEEVFHADSDAVLALLPLLEPGEVGLEERWQLGLAGVDRLLADLALGHDERLRVVRDQRDELVRRLRWDGAARGRVGERFRHARPALEALLRTGVDDDHPLQPGLELLRRRSARVEPVAAELRRLDHEGRLTSSLPEIATSLLHMHLNRLLRGDNVAQELVICDFLARLYAARPPTVTAKTR